MRSVSRFAALVLTSALGATALVGLTGGSANASVGAPFDPSTPQILASKSANAGDPTGLYRLAPNPGGTYSFSQIGSDANLVYNALTYNTDDNYLYAISGAPGSSGVPSGSLLKIGSSGGYEVVGSGTFQEAGEQTNMGAYDPTTREFWVLSAQGSTIYRIDLDTSSPDYGDLIDTVALDTPDHDAQGGGSDLTYAAGAFWTLGRNGIFRIEKDGSTTQWATPTGAGSATANDQAGAAWTFLNGDLGFSYNGSGEVVRIRVTNPASATPTFTTVVKSGGSASGQNDGAAIPGTVDLEIEKTGEIIDDGASVAYQIVVTNNGGAASSGWTVTDTLPSGLTNVVVGGAGSESVSGNTVTVTGSSLEVGATATITITATSPSPRPASLTNSASVEGADPDPVASNNQDRVVLTYPAPTDPTDPADPADPADPSDPAVLPATGAAAGGGPSLLAYGGAGVVFLGLAVLAAAGMRRLRETV